MASNSSAMALFFLFLFHFVSSYVFASEAVIEDGYAVTTVIDGHKIEINPYAVMLKPGSSDLVVLDYSRSAFYTVPFPVSKDSVIKWLSGGDVGYNDGEPGLVQFNQPRSFAVDSKGNVYVADKKNNVIRKITNSGVTTTIAGVNKKTGRDDGPVQNATFSNDFTLVFAVEICALLVSDHGNQLVRQIDLKAEDCRSDSGSVNDGMFATLIWSVVVGVALLVGFVVGFVARPCMFTHEGSRIDRFSKTWKLCLINLGKLVPILCFVIRSAVANFSLVGELLERLFFQSLSHLSLVFRTNYLVVPPRVLPNEPPSLLDSDGVGCSNSSRSEMTMVSEKYANQLKDLICFDGRSGSTSPIIAADDRCNDDLAGCFRDERLDIMIKTNVVHFAGVTKETSNLVNRR